MTALQIALLIAACVVGAFLLFFFLPTMLISNVIYTTLLVRKNKKKWSRECSWEDEEQQRMFDEGKAWGEGYSANMTSVEVKSGKLRLVGEYFDFGFDKAAIIIPGRMETSMYSYYFAEPYRKAGYNVLAIDNRSHGLSDGRYNCLGLKEYADITAWAKKLHDELGVKEIVLHGICIGSATALNALTFGDAPGYITAMVADGMYVSFRESLANHIKERKHSLFPCLGQVMWMIKTVSGKSADKYAPINQIKKLDRPILFIYSKEDAYSLPEKGEELFAACASENKKIVFFDHGAHSHVRINNTEKYDETIIGFLTE